jgi:hypothetical protein
VETVYEYYTNPDNLKEAWPQDIVKESESLSSATKNEEGSERSIHGKRRRDAATSNRQGTK